MTKASDNEFPKIILKPLGAPSAPSDASWKLYPMADGVYARSSNAIVGPLGTGGGAVATDAIWDAAGDLAVGSGANTAARLAIGGTNGMVLQRAAGAVAWGHKPFIGCFAYHNTTQSFGATTLTTMSLNAEVYDTNAFHDPASNNSRLTVPFTGYYRITAGIWYATTTGTNYVLIDKNGGASFLRGGAVNSNGGTSGVRLTMDASLAAGDYIEMVGYHTEVGSIATGDTGTTISQQNFMSIEFLGV